MDSHPTLILLKEVRTFVERARATGDDRDFATAVDMALAASTTSNADFAEEVHASEPTVARWREGRSTPVPTIRPAIFAALDARIAGVIEAFEAFHTPKP